MKLTFENWLKGEIELVETTKNYDSKKNLNPTFHSINSFPLNEVKKIKKKQEELFKESVANYSEKLILDFNERYVHSDQPMLVLKKEAKRIVGIIRGAWLNDEKLGDSIYSPAGDLFMDKNSYADIQNYINRKLLGKPNDLTIVPSPKSAYFEQGTILPQVFFESLYEVFRHLAKFDPKLKVESLYNDDFSKLVSTEPFNKHPKIFTSGYSYNAFLMAVEIIVLKKSEVGDHLFIFDVLNKHKVDGIMEKVSRERYITFLNEEYNLELNENNNKSSDSPSKKKAMAFVLKIYFQRIKKFPLNKIDSEIQKIIG